MSQIVTYAITLGVALLFGLLASSLTGKLAGKLALGLIGFGSVVGLVIAAALSPIGYNKPTTTTIGDGYTTRVVKARNAFYDGLIEITWTDNSGKEHTIEATPEQDQIPETGTLTVSTSTPNSFGKTFGGKTKSTVRPNRATCSHLYRWRG